ncbi:MAG: nitroreductase family protein [Nitrospirae bacterium]|nr:nitroreductase family protein [Nitrospirota bacterium]
MKKIIRDLIIKNRSVRRFYEAYHISMETLEELVDLARLSPSAGNLQPLKYILSNSPERNEQIFSCLSWAAYLKDWPGPEKDERPSAYIVILGDRGITQTFHCDHGIAAQSILLGARAAGLAGCIIGSINRPRLREILSLPEQYEILLVIAIGMPREEVVIEEVGPEGDIKYWRDEKGVHHVPKRRLSDIILEI